MKINLTIQNENTIETVQHNVKAINLFQLQKTLIIVKEVFEIVQADDSLKALFLDIAESEAATESEESKNNKFMEKLLSAFDTLLINVPQKAISLISTVSGIEEKLLLEQEAETLFDVYDAILAVNDIDKLIKRGKKSLQATKNLKGIFNNQAAAQAVTKQA